MTMHDDRDKRTLSELRKDIGAAIAVLVVISFGALVAMQIIDIFK